ncbi:hypothetical protein LTR36_007617 [Oleoguttula mirabilis]|uniref:F-box domain-containing protein n=1 Tax=Oleoguttula mirabilis TaxID=1507867 RepID=A0AAV9JUE7_9PEZI|nr:hypothetical protein LTR36_007617 [Oleoguttula mirabilis]
MSPPQESAAPAGTAFSTTSSQAEEYTIVQTAPRKKTKQVAVLDEDGPLIDTTEALAKNSKKLARLQKKQQKKQAKSSFKVHNFLDLPAELLQEILGHLRPSDVRRVAQLNTATRDFIQQNETSIAKDIIERRYWVLRRCFPLPLAFEDVEEPSRAALLNPRWQERTGINKKPYSHIKALDAQDVCSCPSCLLAWNNLNVVLDFEHFQWNLDHREPIPMIPRGSNPEWNRELTESHARTVEKAMGSPLCYAAILEMHLNSILGTLLRQARFPPKVPIHRHNKPTAAAPAKTAHPIRLYQVTEKDASTEEDSFLERDGRPSYEMPFHRDNYYNLLAYVPNRKWSREEQRWVYYAAGAHERDLAWVRDRFMPVTLPAAYVPEGSHEEFAAKSQAAMATESR